MNSYSQSFQDIFASKMCNIENGYFLEIGSSDPIVCNNTYLLEKEYNWKGLMVEYDKKYEESYKINRPNSIYVIEDARNVNYRKIMDDNNFPSNMNYLQIDLDVDNRSTLTTLELLDATIFDKYKFATITFEHDIYCGDFFNTREISREIFAKRGYVLVFPDVQVYWGGKYSQYEDWYAHPDLIDINIINKVKTSESLPEDAIVKILEKM